MKLRINRNSPLVVLSYSPATVNDLRLIRLVSRIGDSDGVFDF